VLRDERAVLPVAAYNDRYDTTLSLISVVGASGVVKMYEPPMSDDERRGLEASAEALRNAKRRVLLAV